MLLYTILLPLFFFFSSPDPANLVWQQDLEKDYRLLNSSQYFISDNSSDSPSLQHIEKDFSLFQLAAQADLSQSTYSEQQHGKHLVKKWVLPVGDITAIYQIESIIRLDSTINIRYLENRPQTQQRVRNTFTFRTYLVATAQAPAKLFYVSEAEQGLLTYHIGTKDVAIVYSEQKEGLTVVLPAYYQEIELLADRLQNE